jgi:transcriptional regulator with XRE-family HTH domain
MKNRLAALKDRAETARASVAYRAESVMIRFTEELISLMAKKAMTRTALAEKIDVSPAYITKILKGDTNFTLDTMVKISAALDCDLSTHLSERGFQTRWFDVGHHEQTLSVASNYKDLSSQTFDYVKESPFALTA